MKKILFVLASLLVYVGISKATVESNIIPEDAIRVRVIANSNSDLDQAIKSEVKDSLVNYLKGLLEKTPSVDMAINQIESNLERINNIVESTLDNRDTFKINYGLNYFPPKEYKGVTYDGGYYNSLVVTIGEGLGDNWWCVLFPPLCLIEAEEGTEVEYRSYITDIINKYF